MFATTMEADTKKALGTLAVVAAVGGGFYLFNKGKKLLAGAKMNFALLGFRIHKVDLKEVQFAVKLRSYNPTNAPVTLAINQVTANYNGSPIAFSTPDIKGLKINAGKYEEPEIMFQVPYLNLIGKGLSVPLLQDSTQLSKNMSFTLSMTINGESITTTQNLTSDQDMNGLGQLGLVSGKRNTQNGKKYNHLIKRAEGKDILIKNGSVLETVETAIDMVAEHYREVEALAKTLQGSSVKDTCRNIFNFSYNYLQYQQDESGTEQLRTPARSWLDGQIKYAQKGNKSSGIDCDDYSIFVGSLLKNLGIPFKFRITKYDGRSNFQHIYVFVPAKGDSEDEIIIDPVLSKFDYQKPYSFQKSDFDMSPLKIVAGVRGIDGLTGATGLGLPIYALSGLNGATDDDTELMSIISGIDFEDTINGLGSAEDATLRYLISTRDFLQKNSKNKSKMSHIQNPDQFIEMLNQAIKHWNTPERDKVLDKLIAIEDKLAEKGLIKYDIDAIEGFAELDGLGKWKLKNSRFFKAVKKVGKKVGKSAKKVVKAIVRYNPLSIAIRGGLLAALRLNMFGFAKKLQYAYLPDSHASKYNIDSKKLAELKKIHKKVLKLFLGLQGKEHNLKKAIIKGAKQKSKDFSIKGLEELQAELRQLEAIGELAELGNLGEPATAASVTAASGLLAKIGSWLKPIKNIISIFKKKPVQATTQQTQNTVNTYSQPQLNQEDPTQQVKLNDSAPKPKGLSKGTKVGIGVGLAAILGTGAYFIFRNDGARRKGKSKETAEKKTLGRIELV